MPNQSSPSSEIAEDASEAGALDADRLVQRHGASASLGRILNIGAAAASLVILARLLEPEDYGRFVVIRTALSVLGIVAAFGLDTTVLQMLGTCLTDSTPARPRGILAMIGRASAVSFLLASLLAVLGTVLFGEEYLGHSVSLKIIAVVAVGTIVSGGISVVTDALRGIGRPGLANLLGFARGQGSSLVHIGVIIVLSMLTLFTVPTWETAVGVYVLVMTIVVVGSLIALLRPISRGVANADSLTFDAGIPTTTGAILWTSWPIAAATLLTLLTTTCDLFFTSNFAATDGVGPYVAARRVIMLLSIPMSILNQTSRGIIIPMRAHQMDERLEQVLRSGATLVSIPCLIAAGILMLTPDSVLRIILGPGYDGAAHLLQILIPGQMAFVMTGACYTLLQLTGHQRTIILIDGVICLIMFAGGIWISTTSGATGLAILFSVCTAARNLLLWAAARKMTGINTAFGFRSLPDLRSFLDQYRALRRTSRVGKSS